MKKSILILGTAMLLFMGSVALTSCNNAPKSKNTETEQTDKVVQAKYQCPMKCEGNKTYDEPGKCPKCGMDLKEVK